MLAYEGEQMNRLKCGDAGGRGHETVNWGGFCSPNESQNSQRQIHFGLRGARVSVHGLTLLFKLWQPEASWRGDKH